MISRCARGLYHLIEKWGTIWRLNKNGNFDYQRKLVMQVCNLLIQGDFNGNETFYKRNYLFDLLGSKD